MVWLRPGQLVRPGLGLCFLHLLHFTHPGPAASPVSSQTLSHVEFVLWPCYINSHVQCSKCSHSFELPNPRAYLALANQVQNHTDIQRRTFSRESSGTRQRHHWHHLTLSSFERLLLELMVKWKVRQGTHGLAGNMQCAVRKAECLRPGPEARHVWRKPGLALPWLRHASALHLCRPVVAVERPGSVHPRNHIVFQAVGPQPLSDPPKGL